MNAHFAPPPLRVRTLWLSDIHLGSRDCQAQTLLHFLAQVECETLYLVGDIIDFWALKRRFTWPASHYEVIRTIMLKAQQGTRVVYLPGNHDEALLPMIGHRFGPVEVQREAMHRTEDGRRLLVLHGDCFDAQLHLGWTSRHLGNAAYDLLMVTHRWCNRVRRWLGKPYWSLANHVKDQLGNARAAIDAYEQIVMSEVRRRGLDGVVCGHIHVPRIKHHGALVYCNDGDWTESCSALVEWPDGRLELVYGHDAVRRSAGSAAEQAMPAMAGGVA